MKPKSETHNQNHNQNHNHKRFNIELLDKDILCIIFSFLDLFDLVRSSSVCKSWNSIIGSSKLLHALYLKQWANNASNSSVDMGRPLNAFLEDLALQHHRSVLVEGSVAIDQWKGHETGVGRCRMKAGLILTGIGDKVMRLWSSDNYKCLEEYSLSDLDPLVDFDFDESKVVGLIGTRLCIWRRNGNRCIFPFNASTFPKGTCMRYLDPEAFVGCVDGGVRVFDMYSKRCSRIIRMHNSPVSCLALGEDQLIVSASVHGGITVFGQSPDQQVATLRVNNHRAVRTLCYNPSSHLVFAGSIDGYAACWDLRTMQSVWSKWVGSDISSMQFLRNDTSTLVVGGRDGGLCILDHNTGEILTKCVLDSSKAKITSRNSLYGSIERKRVKRINVNENIGGVIPHIGGNIPHLGGHIIAPPIHHHIRGNIPHIGGNIPHLGGDPIAPPIHGNIRGYVPPIAANILHIAGNIPHIAGNIPHIGGNIPHIGGNVHGNIGGNIGGIFNIPNHVNIPNHGNLPNHNARRGRSPISSLAVGMGKVVTTDNTEYIRVWRFNKSH